MESTGKYYVPVCNSLEGHISNVVVANPKDELQTLVTSKISESTLVI